MTTDCHIGRTTIFGTSVFHDTKNFSVIQKLRNVPYLGCTCSKHPLGYLYSENKCPEFPNTLLFHPWKWETGMGDLFKDLVESGAKETVENFIVVQGCKSCYKVVQDCDQLYMAVHGFTWFYMVVQCCPILYNIVHSHTRL